MKYVKITAETHPQALQKLRDTYGADAMVYSEQEIPARSLVKRLVGKKEYEIWAALFEKKEPPKNVKGQINDLQKMLSNSSANSFTKKETVNFVQKSLPNSSVDKNYTEVSSRESLNSSKNSSISKEVNSLPISKTANSTDDFLKVLQKELDKKQIVVSQEIANSKKAVSNQTENSTHWQDLVKEIHVIKDHLSSISTSSNSVSFSEKEFENFFQYMQSQEFSLLWSKNFINQLKNDLAKNYWSDRKKIHERALSHLERHIPIAVSATKKVMVLLGPTGVGKTTTLAKLSARMQLRENKKVSLVTLDNYRIAATEQLRLFANIIEAPVYVFKEPQKFQNFVENDNSDIILVDTTGFNSLNREFLLEQKQYFSGRISKKIEKHLVLSATTRISDARFIIENFQEMQIDKMVLSKMDEATCYGGFVELAESLKLPFSYFTNGQEVSKDFLPADSEFLSQKILNNFLS